MKITVILFGASNCGIKFYNEHKEEFELAYFCDNDPKKWGNELCGLKILSPKEIINYKEYLFIITSMYKNEIETQLINLGIKKILNSTIFEKSLDLMGLFSDKLYFYKNNAYLKNINLQECEVLFLVYKKVSFKIKSLANIIKQFVKKVHIMCVNDDNNLEVSINNEIIKFKETKQLSYFINNSEYDLIHVPSYLKDIQVLKECQFIKPVVYFYDNSNALNNCIFDNGIIHDLIQYKMNEEHKSEYSKDCIIDLIDSKNASILCINNYATKDYMTKNTSKTKLSDEDKELHCVYIGNLSNNKESYCYLENKFLDITQNNIHVHFYTEIYDDYYKELENLNSYLHYEGIVNYCSTQEISKYDIGIMIYNFNDSNRFFLSTLILYNLFFYNEAKLPVAVEATFFQEQLVDSLYYKNKKRKVCKLKGGLEYLNNLVIRNDIGNSINLKSDNLKQQLMDISNLKVNNIILMDDYKEKILEFYNKIFNSNEKTKDLKSEITILIPTKNRANLLKRCLTYFNTMNCEELSINLIVLDSSDEEDEVIKIKDFLDNNKISNLRYYDFEEKNDFILWKKILFGLKKTKTQYFSMCADDDFITKEAIKESIKILEKDKEIITVFGTQIYWINNNLSKVYVPEHACYCISLDQNDPFERLSFYMGKQFDCLFYNIFRKDQFMNIAENINEYNLNNGFFQELLLYTILVVSGKIKKIDKKYNLTDRSLPVNIEFLKKNFNDKIFDGTFNDYYIELKRILKKYLESIGYEIDTDIFNENIDKAFPLLVKILLFNVDKKFIDINNGEFDLKLLKEGLYRG